MSQLTIVERSTINALRREGKTFRYISRRLSRAASTVTREFKRNMRPSEEGRIVDCISSKIRELETMLKQL
jgi:IS30 family transposase